MTILIIDDEKFVFQILGPVLQGQGYDVQVAEDGEEGLKKIVSLKPDLVLLDILMPRMDGCELLEKIKEQGLPLPRTIVLSALNQDDKVERALSLGAEEYWIKSDLDVKDIVQRINAKLGKTSLEAEK